MFSVCIFEYFKSEEPKSKVEFSWGTIFPSTFIWEPEIFTAPLSPKTASPVDKFKIPESPNWERPVVISISPDRPSLVTPDLTVIGTESSVWSSISFVDKTKVLSPPNSVFAMKKSSKISTPPRVYPALTNLINSTSFLLKTTSLSLIDPKYSKSSPERIFPETDQDPLDKLSRTNCLLAASLGPSG